MHYPISGPVVALGILFLVALLIFSRGDGRLRRTKNAQGTLFLIILIAALAWLASHR